jgi:hypothetical protein
MRKNYLVDKAQMREIDVRSNTTSYLIPGAKLVQVLGPMFHAMFHGIDLYLQMRQDDVVNAF